jgi:hypothetical protein
LSFTRSTSLSRRRPRNTCRMGNAGREGGKW